MRRQSLIWVLLGGAALAAVLAWCGGDPTPGPTAGSAALDAARPAAAAESGSGSVQREEATRPPAPTAASREDPTGSASSGTLRVQVVDADRDEAPVPGLELLVYELLPDQPAPHRISTDAEGTVVVEGLAPGRIRVRTARHSDASESVDITAGSVTEVRLALVGSIRISGIVVDAVGVPVADAEVLLADPTGANPVVVAQSEADGTFAIHPADKMGNVAARAEGFAPSNQRLILATPGAHVDEVRLVLPGAGGSLIGTAIDATGRPVVDVEVGVGPMRTGQPILPMPDGSRGSPPLRPVTRTDAEGRFRLIGLEPGTHSVIATSRRHPPWFREVEILPHQAAHVSIRFGVGGAFEGTVRDEEGELVAGIHVTAGKPMTPAHRRVRTDDEGRFRIDGLTPGSEISLRAIDRERGRAETVMVPRAGETATWDAQLSRGNVLRGRIEGPDGSCPERVNVQARASGSGSDWSGWAQPDTDGRFEFLNCPDAIDLDVTAPGFAALHRAGIDRAAGEVVLRLEPEITARARIIARVLDPDGQPVVEGMMHIGRNGHGGGAFLYTDAEGRLDVGDVLPGVRNVRIHAGTWATFYSGDREVAPGETWDLGTVQLTRGGRIELRLDRGPETEGRAVWHSVYRGDEWLEGLTGEDGHLWSGPLEGGDYVIRIWGPELVSQQIPVRVREGATTSLRTRLEAGVTCVFTFDAPAALDAARIPFEVLEGGRVVFSRSATRGRDGSVAIQLGLAPGRYVVRSSFGGLAAETLFTVEQRAEPCAVKVELR